MLDSALGEQPAGRKAAANVEDVVPAAKDDPRGTGLSSSVLPLVLAGILVGLAGTFLARGLAARAALVTVGSVLTGATAVVIAQGWLGILEHNWLGNWGVFSLVVLSITSVVPGFEALFGAAGAAFGSLTMTVVGNPFSAVSSAPEMLPQPLGVIGQLMPPGAGGNLLRSTAFVDGAAAGGDAAVLGAWVFTGMAALLAAAFRQRASRSARLGRSRQRELAALSSLPPGVASVPGMGVRSRRAPPNPGSVWEPRSRVWNWPFRCCISLPLPGEPVSVAVPSAAAALERLPVAGIAVLSLGALDFGLEQSLILPALPSLADHYDASLVGVSWLATGFLVTGTVAVPLLGRLGDLYGRRLLLLVALGAFAAGSLVCALTDSIELAIAGRCVQGLGVAFSPLALGLARDTLPAGMLPRAVGAVVGAASVGSTLGFLLSGVLVDNISPASIFWLLFVLAAVLVVGVLTLVPEVPARTHVSLDLAGAATLALGLFTLLLAISKGNDWDWTSGVILALLAAAACSLTLFVLLERRVAQPLVDLALVVRKPFANANVCAFAFGYAFFIAVFVVPQIAAAPAASGYGQGLSTTEIGLLLVPTGIGGMLGAWLGGRAVDSVGPRALVALGSLGGVGAYVSLMLEHNSWLGLSIPTAVLGFSAGLILTGIYPVVLRSSGTDKTGVAVAIAFVMRNTAVSLGVAAAFAIIDGAGLVGGFPADGGFTRAFGMGAAGAAVGFVASAFMPGRAVRAAARAPWLTPRSRSMEERPSRS